MKGLHLLLIGAFFVLVTVHPSRQYCDSLSDIRRLYVYLNLENRLFDYSSSNETLLPQSLIRRRDIQETERKVHLVESLLGLMEQTEAVMNLGDTPLLIVFKELFHQKYSDACQYLTQEFQVDCHDKAEIERVLLTLKLRKLIVVSLDAMGSQNLEVNPTCSCIKKLLPPGSLREVAIRALLVPACS